MSKLLYIVIKINNDSITDEAMTFNKFKKMLILVESKKTMSRMNISF